MICRWVCLPIFGIMFFILWAGLDSCSSRSNDGYYNNVRMIPKVKKTKKHSKKQNNKKYKFAKYAKLRKIDRTKLVTLKDLKMKLVKKSKDSDHDGIYDQHDKCPNRPEDKNGIKDKDGCPDGDIDHDGILDYDDKCPHKAEDKDGFLDNDGCPEFDNDNDGINDKDDKCPNKAEVYNGVEDTDGCPDKGEELLKLDMKTKKIRILKRIYFKTASNNILNKSYRLLNVLATTLKNNPSIKKVRIEGHSDDRGDDAYNKLLSEKRANSVMKYLIRKGVSKERLVAHGYGEEKPLMKFESLLNSKDPKAKKELDKARNLNRRVEFTILD